MELFDQLILQSVLDISLNRDISVVPYLFKSIQHICLSRACAHNFLVDELKSSSKSIGECESVCHKVELEGSLHR